MAARTATSARSSPLCSHWRARGFVAAAAVAPWADGSELDLSGVMTGFLIDMTGLGERDDIPIHPMPTCMAADHGVGAVPRQEQTEALRLGTRAVSKSGCEVEEDANLSPNVRVVARIDGRLEESGFFNPLHGEVGLECSPLV